MLSTFVIGPAIRESLARKVYAVDSDPGDNGFLSNGEGWANKNKKPGDTVLVGAPLDSAMKLVGNGDTLIIICHGWGEGQGFWWGGVQYTGFGTGGTLHPIPPEIKTKTNIKIIFVSCWSDRDPDGAGPNKSPSQKLRDSIGAAVDSVKGFKDIAKLGEYVRYTFKPSQTDTGTINNFIRNGNGDWRRYPPVNRVPPANPNQQTRLQAQLDSLKGGTGRVTVQSIDYLDPVNVQENRIASSMGPCDCDCSVKCGCTYSIPIGTPECDNSLYAWSPQSSGTTSFLYSVCAVNSNVAWTAGAGPTVRRTTDGGTTWTDATGSGLTGDVYFITALDDMIAFCTTTPGSTMIYKTMNGGANWTPVFTQAGGFINAIKMTTPTTGYAMGDPVGGKWTILKTTNSGLNWTRMATEPTQIGGELGWSSSFQISGSDIWFGTNSSRIYHSTNLGLSWIITSTPGLTNSYTVHYNNMVTGLAGGEVVMKSTNGGLTYASAGFPGSGGAVSGISGSGSEWWSVKADSIIYHSPDEGATWIPVYFLPGAQFINLDMSSADGCIHGWAVGANGKIARVAPGINSFLNLKVLVQGFWNGSSNVGDTVKAYVRQTTSPYTVLDVATGKTNSSGNVMLSYTHPHIQNGNPYYIVVEHRNSIQTWSKPGGEIWVTSILSYDFTTSSSQAYGSNQILSGGKYCIYGADVNQDGVVDLTDIVMIFNDASVFATGYIPTDVNGDDLADLSDITLAFNNATAFVSVITP